MNSRGPEHAKHCVGFGIVHGGGGGGLVAVGQTIVQSGLGKKKRMFAVSEWYGWALFDPCAESLFCTNRQVVAFVAVPAGQPHPT